MTPLICCAISDGESATERFWHTTHRRSVAIARVRSSRSVFSAEKAVEASSKQSAKIPCANRLRNLLSLASCLETDHSQIGYRRLIPVIPAKAGIQRFCTPPKLDNGFRRYDGLLIMRLLMRFLDMDLGVSNTSANRLRFALPFLRRYKAAECFVEFTLHRRDADAADVLVRDPA